MKSKAARLLAVRRVTQENQGKKTAGVDGVKSVRPKERLLMARHISPNILEAHQSATRTPSVDTEAWEERETAARNSHRV